MKKQMGYLSGGYEVNVRDLQNMSWVTDNINTLGLFHDHNINTETAWKTVINKMKSCTQIWKTNKITVKGKTLIVKNLLVSALGNEIEMRSIPD
jgi:hypothetical protein